MQLEVARRSTTLSLSLEHDTSLNAMGHARLLDFNHTEVLKACSKPVPMPLGSSNAEHGGLDDALLREGPALEAWVPPWRASRVEWDG